VAKLAALPTDDQPDAAVGVSPVDLSAVDTPTLFREVVSRLRMASPAGMANPRFEWDIPGNAIPGRIPLAVPDPKLSEMADEIIDVLRDAEGWMNGAAIAASIDPTGNTEHVGGSFKRAIDELKAAGLIEEPHRRKGYKAKKL
jgi:hypothetical protein